jgi:hypothetical protein
MEQATEEIASTRRAWLAIIDDMQAGGRTYRPQPERPVRPMGVVVLGADV